MSIINQIINTSEILYGGDTITSNPTSTLLLLPPLIVKLVDKAIANIGDNLTYTITITNVGLTSLTNVIFSDDIPNGTEYVVGSFQVNGSPATPTITGDTLSYTIPTILPPGTAIVSFSVIIIGGEE